MARWNEPGYSAADWANELKHKSFSFKFGATGNSEVTIKNWYAPAKGKITGIYVTSSRVVAAANSDLTMTCDGNNCLAATVAVDGITVNTTTDAQLSSTAANLQFDAGDVIKATLTNDGTGTSEDVEVQVLWTHE